MRLIKGSMGMAVLTSISLIVGAGSASAVGFGLGVWETGSGYVGGGDESALGCVSTGVYTSSCSGGDATFGDLTIDSWSINVDEDPVVTGTTAVTNNSLSTQTFTLIFTLAVAPVGPASLIGGSISGTVTDNTGDGATLSTAAADYIYSARIDGLTVATLYGDPSSVIVGAPYGSGNLAAISFGAPIPSQAGPPANSDIGIRLKFMLSPGDSASFTSNFVVTPIPEPSVAVLLGLGLGALGVSRRRERG